MRFRTFKRLCRDRDIEWPEGGVINGQWFADNGFPMIVACGSCGMAMALPNAIVNENGICYCRDCVEPYHVCDVDCNCGEDFSDCDCEEEDDRCDSCGCQGYDCDCAQCEICNFDHDGGCEE